VRKKFFPREKLAHLLVAYDLDVGVVQTALTDNMIFLGDQRNEGKMSRFFPGLAYTIRS